MILVHVQYICMDLLMVQNLVAPVRRKRKRQSAVILSTILETSKCEAHYYIVDELQTEKNYVSILTTVVKFGV